MIKAAGNAKEPVQAEKYFEEACKSNSISYIQNFCLISSSTPVSCKTMPIIMIPIKHLSSLTK